jgi:prepilin-type processing-associated H-X9-DG protein
LVNAARYSEYSCPGLNGQGSPNPTLQGVFFNDHSIDIARIQDGTSNTFIAGESLQSPGHFNPLYGPYWGSGAHTSTHGRINPLGTAKVAGYAPNAPMAAMYPEYANQAVGKLPYAWVFSSRHPGGVNMGMADGSVRFIKNSISLYNWWSLATIFGGEIFGSDAY